jgi:NADH-quinone oxidoreductase subunit L
MTFHGKERFVVEHGHGHHLQPGHLEHAPHESPWVITLPLILLAIPSVLIGWLTVGTVLYGDYFGEAIRVAPANDVLARLGQEFHGPGQALLDSVRTPTLYLALAGIVTAWFLYLRRPELPALITKRLGPIYTLVANKFYFDELYVFLFADGTRGIGRILWQLGDVTVIDGALVNGSAQGIVRLAGALRRGQSGYLYHYAFAMIIGLCALLGWILLK